MCSSKPHSSIRCLRSSRPDSASIPMRYRFERGVDPAFVADGAELASRLILDLCGGVASEPRHCRQAARVAA